MVWAFELSIADLSRSLNKVANQNGESCIWECCCLMTRREPESEFVSLQVGDRPPGSPDQVNDDDLCHR